MSCIMLDVILASMTLLAAREEYTAIARCAQGGIQVQSGFSLGNIRKATI